MHKIDLSALDLNLLVVLDLLLEERSVSRVARRIGRTQSATSHALARLRAQLGDPLLVRTTDGMQPTPRAARLAPELRRTLRALARVVEDSSGFDARTTDRVFTLAGPDFLAAQLPALFGALHARAPHARLELVAPRARMLTDVVDGQLDAALCPPATPLAGLRVTPLAHLAWVVFMRRDHPAARRFHARAWSTYQHVQIRTSAERGPVDIAAERAGVTRTVGAWLPTFQSAAALLAHSDLLLTAPAPVLGELASRFALRALPCPLPVPPIELALHTAEHRAQDPALQLWVDAVQQMFATSRARARP